MVKLTLQEVAGGYATVFSRGLLMVSLVSANTYQVAHGHYIGATFIGFAISLVWFYNARNAARTDLPYAGVVYALGAALGTLAGMLVMTTFWGGR